MGTFSIQGRVCHRIQFWHDLCGDALLKDAFPERFQIAWNKDAMVTKYMDWSNGSLHWNTKFLKSGPRLGIRILGLVS